MERISRLMYIQFSAQHLYQVPYICLCSGHVHTCDTHTQHKRIFLKFWGGDFCGKYAVYM